VARCSSFLLAMTDHELASGDELPRLKRFDRREVAARGLVYADLVAASDVVVSKPGYGIVSECVANGTALAYTSRGRFREYDVMLAEMPGVLRCRFLPQGDLMEGRWEATVNALLEQPAPPTRAATNGADVAARDILGVASGGPDAGRARYSW
jgi:L-arabinokinase